MREIKFRGYSKFTGKMYNELSEILVFKNNLSKSSIRIREKATNEQGEELPYFVTPLIGDLILMQYTGLKDKNGKEIYEGDIAIDNGWKGKVAFIDGMYCIDYFSNKLKANPIGFYETIKNQIEVIGNIYENPELLKETKNAKNN